MKPEETAQGSAAWLSARAGNVTASRLADVLAVSKRTGEPLKAREDYMGEIVAERLTGDTAEHYLSPAMQWGLEHEADAITEYELTHEMVERVGYVPHPLIEHAGASPDGLVGTDGLIEIKCPNTTTHIRTFVSEEIDPRYYAQMQWQMACTGRQWCDFMSYDPRLPSEFAVFIKRVPRDDVFIDDAESRVRLFIDDADEMIEQLKAKAHR